MTRIGDSLAGKRVLVTQSRDFMGPALVEAFAGHAAEVITDERALIDPLLPEALVRAAGHVDVLIANLSIPAPSTPAEKVTDQEWREVFAHLVDPLPRLMRAVLPQMIARRAGKIVVMGSATALRGQKRTSTYTAADRPKLRRERNLLSAGSAGAGCVQRTAQARGPGESPCYVPGGRAVCGVPGFE
jgi:2-keto-3-deoxy-L-fuconate dehydrogenase